eukprot:5578355-Pyramimonas_sp.AAC.1
MQLKRLGAITSERFARLPLRLHRGRVDIASNIEVLVHIQVGSAPEGPTTIRWAMAAVRAGIIDDHQKNSRTAFENSFSDAPTMA